MANGNRCYLCGGKIRRGRCVECGLDNDRMTKRDYRLNVTTPYHVKRQQVAARKAENQKYEKVYEARQQSLENLGKPLHQQQKPPAGKPINTPTKSNTGRTDYQKQASKAYEQMKREANARVNTRRREVEGSKKKWKGGAIIGAVWAIFLLISEVGGCVSDLIDDFSYAEPEYQEAVNVEEVTADPHGTVPPEDYEYVSRELSGDGEFYEQVYGPGSYIVGVHIPEGSYTLEISDGSYVNAYIDDYENGIYMTPDFGEDSYDGYITLEDVRLYEGASVEVRGAGALKFTSEHAKTDGLTGMENPMDLTDTLTFAAGEYEEMQITAGEDIPEGIYDLTAISGWSSVQTDYYVDENNINTEYYWIDADTEEHTYKNVVLIDGMTVTFENCEIQFAPSGWIPTDDYESFYMEYIYY